MGFGVFSLFTLSLFGLSYFAWADSGTHITSIPETVPVQIVYRECNAPKETGDKNTPFENVLACVFPGSIETNAKQAATDRAGVVKVKPTLVFSIGEEERKIELAWTQARAFSAYVNRFHTETQVTYVEMEDGTWNRGTSLGLHIDLTTEKLTVPFKILELVRDYSGKGHLDSALIEIPLEQLSDRVFTKSSTLTVTEDLSQQNFFVNYNLDKLIPIVVLGFEAGHQNHTPAGPLTHFLPGYRNGSHSAVIAVRSELNDPKTKSVRLYRLPVGLLRTVPQPKLAETNARALGTEASLRWLNELNIGAIAVPEDGSERLATLRQYLNMRHSISMSFDMKPPQECRALIVRETK